MKEKTNNASAQVEISPGLKVIANTASGPPEVFPWEKSRDLKTTITTTLAELAATRDRLKSLEWQKQQYEEQLKPLILEICQEYDKSCGHSPAVEIDVVLLDYFPAVEYSGHSKTTNFDGQWDISWLFDKEAQKRDFEKNARARLKKEAEQAEKKVEENKKKANKLRKQLAELEGLTKELEAKTAEST